MIAIGNTVSEQVIWKENTNGYREYRIPGILPVPGALLLVCEARMDVRNDWDDIDIQILRLEEGKEPMEVLRIGESDQPKGEAMRTYNNPVLIPDGEKVHLIYHKNYEMAFVITSEDGGRTWSGAREITVSFREFPFEWNVCATGPGHGIQMKSGRLVAPIWLANGEVLEGGQIKRHWPSVAGCIYSDDHGMTWHAGLLGEGMRDANETAIAEVPGGGLLINFRNRNENYHRVLGLSLDGGESLEKQWTPEELIDPMCMGGMTTAENQVLFVNCDTSESRTSLTVKGSSDAGQSWKALWLVDPVGGYADIAVAGDRIYILYEHTVDHCISDIVLKVAEIRSTEAE